MITLIFYLLACAVIAVQAVMLRRREAPKDAENMQLFIRKSGTLSSMLKKYGQGDDDEMWAFLQFCDDVMSLYKLQRLKNEHPDVMKAILACVDEVEAYDKAHPENQN